MMDKKIKADWVKALRSGDYKQGRGLLRNRFDKFCCLGVLCDITNVPCEKVSKQQAEYLGLLANQYGCYMYRGEPGFIPVTELDKLAFDLEVARDFAELNDGGSSFKEIATLIEQNDSI